MPGKLVAIAMLLMVATNVAAQATHSWCAPPVAHPVWRFAFSGDSRNCGDLVMPAIANSIQRTGLPKVDFYWHMGDFRWMDHIDADMRDSSDLEWQGPPWECNEQSSWHDADAGEYRAGGAWNDFIMRQIEPFTVPVYLGIGNHELYERGRQANGTPTDEVQSRADYLQAFCLSHAKKSRSGGSKSCNASSRTYYRWIHNGVDFINLDDAGPHGFQFDGDVQSNWLQGVLQEDQTDSAVKTIVVGMHRPLPQNAAIAEDVAGGAEIYNRLLGFRERSHKSVYVLASHCHFMMTDIYDTPELRGRSVEGPLCGMVAGTAGARRYQLPAIQSQKIATNSNYDYGYLLADVDAEGKIGFDFRPITKEELSKAAPAQTPKALVNWCYYENYGFSHGRCEKRREWSSLKRIFQ